MVGGRHHRRIGFTWQHRDSLVAERFYGANLLRHHERLRVAYGTRASNVPCLAGMVRFGDVLRSGVLRNASDLDDRMRTDCFGIDLALGVSKHRDQVIAGGETLCERWLRLRFVGFLVDLGLLNAKS